MSIRSASGENVSDDLPRALDVPDTPTIGTATDVGTSRAYNNGSATVTFTAPTTGGGSISSYTATSTPGSLTGTSATSPITVTGLSSATAYTFKVSSTNASGTSAQSSSSGSITATTVPQAPTIGTPSVTNTTTVSLPFTAGATGGKTISSYTATASPTVGDIATSGTSTPLTVTGTFASNTAYTFTMTATNANGTSTASSASSSVTPNPTAFESIATVTGTGSSNTITFSSIPSTYQHLQIRYMSRDTNATTVVFSVDLRLNGDTATNYAKHSLFGTGSGVTSNGSASQTTTLTFATGVGANNTAGVMGVAIIDILDYASTTKYKTLRGVGGHDVNGTGRISVSSGLWMSTNAINSISIIGQGSSTAFTTTSTFALYGIKGA